MRSWKLLLCWGCAVLALHMVAVGTVELVRASAYRRMAQNAADAAALAGARALVRQHPNNAQEVSDEQIRAQMNERAEQSIQRADMLLDDLIGIYLDAEGNALGRIGASSPKGASGIKAVVHFRAPTVLVRLVGYEAWPLKAVATVSLADPSARKVPLP